MRGLLVFALLVFGNAILGRTVSVGTFVSNPGQVVSVGLSVDELSDVGAAVFTINYDSTIVACLGVEATSAIDSGKLTYADTGNGQLIVVASLFTGKSGEVVRIRFLAREGTAGQFSDITIAEADFAAKDGVSDLDDKEQLSIINGMVRVFASDASVRRLEAPFVVWPKTKVSELSFLAGDAIQTSDDGLGISVTHSIEATGEIAVRPPLHGWQSGKYALLSAPRQGLSFKLEGADTATLSSETVEGITTYYVHVDVEGSIEIQAAEGALDAGTIAVLRSSLQKELALYPQVNKVVVKGPVAIIPVIVDLGIVPTITIAGSEATAQYAEPELKIIAFDPKTGLVRIKVTPQCGNTIRSQLVTGCIHVYGTDDLSKRMEYISGTAIDVSDYLKDDTKGEADLTVTMGTHTFLKVKAETQIKKEGDKE